MGSSIKSMDRFWLIALLSIWGLALSSASCKAQNYNEIFRQKKTQEKYLLKQLAYLKLYADQAWKGYKLVSGGLETITDFTSGEFKLHEAFISALSKVSSLVRKDFRVDEIVKFQLGINSSFKALQKSSALSQAPNQQYYRAVQEKVIAECNADLDELLDIVLSGDLEMNDSERLARLKKIHSSMEEKVSFTRWFCTEAQGLLQSQKKEKLDIESIRRLYEKN
ncbi:MAG: hypothetical protein EOP04_03040 [Proteobacteria bacterium]|nr:MAG: hypothetical protein EOP04_03040 [Pseudomonadota bacterium]